MTLCKTKNILKSAIILSIFFAFFLGFNNGNVSATSSPVKSYTTTTNNFTQQALCENNDCVGYNYIHIWVENWTAPVSGYTFFNITNSGSEWFRINFHNTSYVDKQYYFPIVPNDSVLGIKFQAGTTVNWEYLDSLGSGGSSGSLNITENGTYDVSSYDVAVVNVPQDVTEIIEDPISNDFQKVFFAIVENIIPAFGIILVVWFGIDMLSSLIFGRGR